MKRIDFEKTIKTAEGLKMVERKIAEFKAAKFNFQELPVEKLSEVPVSVSGFLKQDDKYVEIGTTLDKDIKIRQEITKKLLELPVSEITNFTDTKKPQVLTQALAGTASYVWAFLFQHADYKGWSDFLYHSGNAIYYKTPYIGNSYNDAVSSIKVFSSKNPLELYLFSNKNFEGRYQRFICAPGQMKAVSYIGNYLNDRASSVLFVQRRKQEYCIDVTSAFIPVIKEEVKKEKDIKLRGEPVVTWDMKAEPLIFVKIPVTIIMSNWPDYDATIRYWIWPYLDNAGKIHAYVKRYGCWVEGGLFTDCIVDRLMKKVGESVPNLNKKILEFIKIAEPFTFKSLYLLPGNMQMSGGIPICASSYDETGEMDDGVSLVLATD